MTDTKTLRDIVIVGGGSAGWMTAAYLARGLTDVNITLIESSDIPTVGVGEATIAAVHRFLDFFGLQEKDWMPACKATYKHSIRYRNWHAPGEIYWHPFEKVAGYKSRLHMGHYWYCGQIAQKNPPSRLSFYEDCFFSVDYLKNNLIPRLTRSDGKPDHFFTLPDDAADKFEIPVTYAYHFDAALMGEFLKTRIAKPEGVTQIIDEISTVRQNERGEIAELVTKSGKIITADLFIDCTGFTSLLLDKTLHEPFEYYAEHLPCDRALAVQIPYVDKAAEMHPYTGATALSAGWVWAIPLTHRIGTGYVYCSAFKTDDAAEAEFRNFLGEERVKDITMRQIKIRVGKHKRVWVKNVIAIGLSAGFIEPLESTGLAFVHLALEKLVHHIKDDHSNVGKVSAYNEFNRQMMDEARDFLSIHYALTAREDSAFWRHCKHDLNLSPAMTAELERYQRRLPNGLERIIFADSSWTCILVGMNYLPETSFYKALPDDEVITNLKFMHQLKVLKALHKNQFLKQSDFVEKYFG